MVKRRRMTAKQLKYFGPRKRQNKVVKVARRRRSYRRYYAKARRAYRSRKGLLSGSIGNVVIGAAAGAISPMIPQFLGQWTNPVAFGIAGYFFKKPALMSIAGYELGKSLMGGGQASNGGSGGWL